MTDLKTKSFHPGLYRNLDIEEIITAPLAAASKANGMLAKEQTRFLMDFCFSKDGDNYSPVMITMTITKGVIQPVDRGDDEITIRQITTSFCIPLLTIIPINSLAVETVTVDFEIEITSERVTSNTNDDLKPRNTVSANQRVKLFGKLSYDSKEKSKENGKRRRCASNSSSLKINIRAGQLPIPMGVATLLDLYTKTIQPINSTSQIPEKEK